MKNTNKLDTELKDIKSASSLKVDNSIKTQLLIIEAALRESKNGLNTFQIREGLNIVEVAARIWQLRFEKDLNIQKSLEEAINAQGHKHQSVARYFIFAGKYSESPEGIASAKKRGVDHE